MQIDRPVVVAPSAEAPASRPVAPTVVVEPERDPDAEADACDVAADAGTKLTDDEELPAAQGGVA